MVQYDISSHAVVNSTCDDGVRSNAGIFPEAVTAFQVLLHMGNHESIPHHQHCFSPLRPEGGMSSPEGI